jgi:hypothetical protein
MMKTLHKNDPRFKEIKHASSPKAKQALWDRCMKEDSVDGVVAINIDEVGSKLTKIKFKHHHDNWHRGTIVDFTPQKGDKSAEMVYPILENKWGKTFVCSGMGVTDAVKRDMLNNPDNYLGREVLYSAERHFDNHVPFQPVIKELEPNG